jgi:hypothetical protein
MFTLFLLVEAGYEKEGCFMAQGLHASPDNICMHCNAGDSVMILLGNLNSSHTEACSRLSQEIWPCFSCFN